MIAIGGISVISKPEELPPTPPPPISGLQITLQLSNKEIIFADIGNDLTSNGKDILFDMMLSNKRNLIRICKKYEEDGREVFNFMYDLLYLVKALQELPDEFQYLKDVKDNAELLMHNSLLTNICLEYTKRGHKVEPEPDRKHAKPDLKINDSIFGEIKTIISPKDNTQISFQNFANTFRSRLVKARKQVGTEGMIFMSPWSGIINSLYYSYYIDMKNDQVHDNQEFDILDDLPEPQESKTVTIIATPDVFKDKFLISDTTDVVSKIENFAEQYYLLFSKPQYTLKYLRMQKGSRNGFVTGSLNSNKIEFRTG